MINIIDLIASKGLGAKVGTLGRQNKRNSNYVRLTHTSIFGLVYYMVDRLLTGLTAQQTGATTWWYSNKSIQKHCTVSVK